MLIFLYHDLSSGYYVEEVETPMLGESKEAVQNLFVSSLFLSLFVRTSRTSSLRYIYLVGSYIIGWVRHDLLNWGR